MKEVRLSTIALFFLVFQLIYSSCGIHVYVSPNGPFDTSGAQGSERNPFPSLSQASTVPDSELYIHAKCAEYEENVRMADKSVLVIDGSWRGSDNNQSKGCVSLLKGLVNINAGLTVMNFTMSNFDIAISTRTNESTFSFDGRIANIMLDSISGQVVDSGEYKVPIIVGAIADVSANVYVKNLRIGRFWVAFAQSSQSLQSLVIDGAHIDHQLGIAPDQISQLIIMNSYIHSANRSFIVPINDNTNNRAHIIFIDSILAGDIYLEAPDITLSHISATNSRIGLGYYIKGAEEEVKWSVSNSTFVNTSVSLIPSDGEIVACEARIYFNTFEGTSHEDGNFEHDPTPVLVYFSPDKRCTINARNNYYGSASGPRSCCNPAGTGGTVFLGIDHSAWCTTPECTVFDQSPSLPECYASRMCTAGENILLISIGSVILVIAVAGAIMITVRFRSEAAQLPRLVGLSALVLVMSVIAQVAVLVFFVLYRLNTITLHLNWQLVTLLLAIITILNLLSMIQGILGIVIAKARRGMWAYIVFAVAIGFTAFVMTPSILITQQNFAEMMIALPHLFFQSFTRPFWLITVPYEPIVLYLFALPAPITMLFAARMVWNILIETSYPDLHRMYIALQETESLLARRDELLVDVPHRRSANSLFGLSISAAILAVLAFSMSMLFATQVHPFINSFTTDLRKVVYLGSAGFICTGIGIIIHNVFGIYVWRKQFNNNALVLASLLPATGLAAAIVFLIAMIVINAATLESLFACTRTTVGSVYYTDAASIVTLGSDNIHIPAVIALCVFAIVLVIEIVMSVLSVIHSRKVRQNLPAILSRNIDNALEDIYEGK